MRAWLLERRVYGREPAGERDTEGLNRVFADASPARSRRDGLVGVRVPHLNPQVWRYALLDAGPGAMLWRDEAGYVVGFNIAHRSGAEGWMGPLAVRPDRQGAGVGKTIVRTVLDWLLEQDVATLGLETMPRTVENIGFYARLGFFPGHLTVTLTNDIVTRGHQSPGVLSPRQSAARGPARAPVPPGRGPRLSRPLDRPPDDLRGLSRAPSRPWSVVLELGDLNSAECGMGNAELKSTGRFPRPAAAIDVGSSHSAFRIPHSALA